MTFTNGIIVCNQDLLAINMKKRSDYRTQLMNENLSLIVIDEVHNLESRVRSSVTESISLHGLKQSLYGASKAVSLADRNFLNEIKNADRLIDAVFLSLQHQMNEQDKVAKCRGQEIDRYYVKKIDSNFRKLERLLADIQFKASMAFGDFVGDRNRRNFDAEIEALEDDVEFLKSLNRSESEDIFWIERVKKEVKGIKLYKCPKEVDKITKRILFHDQEITTILTSATITSGKNSDYKENYKYFIKNTGFSAEAGKICEPKESPFNYDEHAMIYYTEHLPHPSKEREAFIEEGVKEIIKLLQISNGKALILFTAKTDMKEVFDRLSKEDLSFELMISKGNSKQAEILNKFRTNINSVLFGTGSFWEGINIEGVSLSHVIIFKLPFPVREPIVDYECSICDDGLMEVLVPEMVIKLKQGIGRLIRSETDKGIVSIIDSRVGESSSSRYKEIIWNSLPIKNRSNKIEVLKHFYDNIVS